MVKPILPHDSAERKRIPLGTGVIDYFSAALAEVAKVSFAGNEKHNPGQPLHWSRGKSGDHADCMLRHFVDRGTIDPNTHVRATAEMAWRALAILQEEMEAAGAPPSRASRFPVPRQPEAALVRAVIVARGYPWYRRLWEDVLDWWDIIRGTLTPPK